MATGSPVAITPEQALDDIVRGIEVIMRGITTFTGESGMMLSVGEGSDDDGTLDEEEHRDPEQVLDDMKEGAATILLGVGALRALGIEVGMLRRRRAEQEKRGTDG